MKIKIIKSPKLFLKKKFSSKTFYKSVFLSIKFDYVSIEINNI